MPELTSDRCALEDADLYLRASHALHSPYAATVALTARAKSIDTARSRLSGHDRYPKGDHRIARYVTILASGGWG